MVTVNFFWLKSSKLKVSNSSLIQYYGASLLTDVGFTMHNYIICMTTLTLFYSLKVAVTIASTHYTYPQRDGQAELAWLTG